VAETLTGSAVTTGRRCGNIIVEPVAGHLIMLLHQKFSKHMRFGNFFNTIA
jgi:hypothetical protein